LAKLKFIFFLPVPSYPAAKRGVVLDHSALLLHKLAAGEPANQGISLQKRLH